MYEWKRSIELPYQTKNSLHRRKWAHDGFFGLTNVLLSQGCFQINNDNTRRTIGDTHGNFIVKRGHMARTTAQQAAGPHIHPQSLWQVVFLFSPVQDFAVETELYHDIFEINKL